MKKSFFEDLPARKKPAHVPADGTPDGVDSNEGGVDAKKVRQAVYDIRYRAKREDVELELAMSQYFSNTTMTTPEKDAVKAKLFGEGYGLISQQIWSDTLEERAKGTGRDRKYRIRVTDKVSGRKYARWANREKISKLRSNPSIGAQGVEMSDAGKAYEGDDDDAGKTKEAPKAKKDNKKPTKKEDPKMKKEEYLDEMGKRDQSIRDRIAMFKKGNIEHTPPKNWDPDANRGKGATVSPKQAEKRRRKALRSEEVIDEDSRRMSNKQHTARVRSNIKSFGSNYTPPSNYDPDANRGQGEVLTRKQIEKKRRKALRSEEAKAKRWWDDDGDGKGYEPGEVDGKFPDKDGSKKKKKHTKKEESQFSNWREIFMEEMGDKIDKVTEKKVNNKITINPEQGKQ
jgi:hypothetical protein